MQNIAKFGRNLMRYLSVQHIWNLSQQIYLETSPLKHANNVLKLPDVDYVAKNWALAMTLKALPLVHFWSVLLLKEQMMTSVWKTLIMRVWSAKRFLANFPWKLPQNWPFFTYCFLGEVCPENSQEIGQFFWEFVPKNPAKFDLFFTTYDKPV